MTRQRDKRGKAAQPRTSGRWVPVVVGAAGGALITYVFWSVGLQAIDLPWSVRSLVQLHVLFPSFMAAGLAPLVGGLTGLIGATLLGEGESEPHTTGSSSDARPVSVDSLPDLPDAMLLVDHRGMVLQHNRSARALFGEEALRVRSLLDMIPGYLDATSPRSRRAHDGSSLGAVWLVRARDAHGFSFEAELSFTPLPDGSSLFVVRDLHEQRSIELQQRTKDVLLTELRHQAAESKRAKAAFLDTMGQDLLGPLMAITGYVDVLRRDMDLVGESAYVQDLVRIEQAAEELGSMINRVLDYSQAAGQSDALVIDHVDLEELLSSVIEECDPWTQRNGNRIELEVDEDLEGVETDHVHLHQALFYLLETSARYADCSIIKVEAERREDLVVIDLRIANPGARNILSGAEVERETSSDSITVGIVGGSGLGVAMAREYVTRLGGHVRRSRTASGTPCFRVVLPVRPLSAEPASPAGSVQTQPKTQDKLSRGLRLDFVPGSSRLAKLNESPSDPTSTGKVSGAEPPVELVVRSTDAGGSDESPTESDPSSRLSDAKPAAVVIASASEESAPETEEGASESEESASESEESASESEESASESEESASEPEEGTAEPEESASEPEESAPASEESASEPKEGTAEPEESAPEPDEGTAEPKERAAEPRDPSRAMIDELPDKVAPAPLPSAERLAAEEHGIGEDLRSIAPPQINIGAVPAVVGELAVASSTSEAGWEQAATARRGSGSSEPVAAADLVDFWPDVEPYRRRWGRVNEARLAETKDQSDVEATELVDPVEVVLLDSAAGTESELQDRLEGVGAKVRRVRDFNLVPAALTEALAIVFVRANKAAPDEPWSLVRLLADACEDTDPTVCLIDGEGSELVALPISRWLFRPFAETELAGCLTGVEYPELRSALVLLHTGQERRGLVSALVRAGWVVRATPDAVEAARLIKSYAPSLILGDPSLSKGICETMVRESATRHIVVMVPVGLQAEARVVEWLGEIPRRDSAQDILALVTREASEVDP